jgi:hypothetical protein
MDVNLPIEGSDLVWVGRASVNPEIRINEAVAP